MIQTLVCFYFLIAPLALSQTNNILDVDTGVHQLEDLYSLKILDKTKFKFNLSGQIIFDRDQFGGIKRVISYSTFKILF